MMARKKLLNILNTPLISSPHPDTWQGLVHHANDEATRGLCRYPKNPFGSPIEELMATTICLCLRTDPVMVSSIVFESLFDRTIADVQSAFVDGSDHVVCYPQVTIDQFRVDFLFYYRSTDGNELKIIVECDGHDFHEKTKEQARRDKARDRKLQSDGYKVFRYTGSEVWNASCECAMEVLWAVLNDHLDMFGREPIDGDR